MPCSMRSICYGTALKREHDLHEAKLPLHAGALSAKHRRPVRVHAARPAKTLPEVVNTLYTQRAQKPGSRGQARQEWARAAVRALSAHSGIASLSLSKLSMSTSSQLPSAARAPREVVEGAGGGGGGVRWAWGNGRLLARRASYLLGIVCAQKKHLPCGALQPCAHKPAGGPDLLPGCLYVSASTSSFSTRSSARLLASSSTTESFSIRWLSWGCGRAGRCGESAWGL